jgi:hypothetical protein
VCELDRFRHVVATGGEFDAAAACPRGVHGPSDRSGVVRQAVALASKLCDVDQAAVRLVLSAVLGAESADQCISAVCIDWQQVAALGVVRGGGVGAVLPQVWVAGHGKLRRGLRWSLLLLLLRPVVAARSQAEGGRGGGDQWRQKQGRQRCHATEKPHWLGVETPRVRAHAAGAASRPASEPHDGRGVRASPEHTV